LSRDSPCASARLRAESLFDLKGRVALVTGGGTGLGRAIAGVLLVNGGDVLIVGKEQDPIDATVAELDAGPGRIAGLAADLTRDEDIARTFDLAGSRFGVPTVVVNAAGVGHRTPALKIGRNDWLDIAAVNSGAAFAVSREAAARMIDAGAGGSIVNLSSFLAARTMRNVAAYAASKAAMTQMTRSLALEWARHGIRVNEIAPGWFPTAMTAPFLEGRAGQIMAETNPMRRLGHPCDLAGAILLLASDAGRYITGASIAVDGGQSLA
jgi:NAD(P)-dependent dehydrogenase (short-subunit alcohol dehydrogenase family)